MWDPRLLERTTTLISTRRHWNLTLPQFWEERYSVVDFHSRSFSIPRWLLLISPTHYIPLWLIFAQLTCIMHHINVRTVLSHIEHLIRRDGFILILPKSIRVGVLRCELSYRRCTVSVDEMMDMVETEVEEVETIEKEVSKGVISVEDLENR